MQKLSRKLCVAPMMTHTDRHFRYFLRLITPNALLFTEMVTTGALIHGDARRYLQYNQAEHPLALQLGGSDPGELALCAKLAVDYGYDEVNLNVGCPSDRVQSGAFGACLMKTPALVADCVHAMQAVVAIPVSVKCRIGIDTDTSYASLLDFIEMIAAAGCRVFYIHARNAWLQGLSPRQNREVPPLNHDYVYRIKRDLPDLQIIINGGITSTAQACAHLEQVDGVMLGRVVCNNPMLLSELDTSIFDLSDIGVDRLQVLDSYREYVSRELAKGTPLSHTTRNILGLFHGEPGARAYRRYLSDFMYQPGAGVDVLIDAIGKMKTTTNNIFGNYFKNSNPALLARF